jgi:hypothetical protein
VGRTQRIVIQEGSVMTRSIVQICFAAGALLEIASTAGGQNIVVDAAPSHVANSFSPFRALGAAIDRLRAPGAGRGAGNLTGPARKATREEVEKHVETILSGQPLKEILDAGWQTVTYRQNTELHIEAWHWNPKGVWSNAAKQEGYFVGNAQPGLEPIKHSWAYPLPHRGTTTGSGEAWSKLTDGELNTYWKSNPYLTKDFTGESDSLHPQWVVLDLGSKIDINAIRIAWTNPYARTYSVQFWTGPVTPIFDNTGVEGNPDYLNTWGTWKTFPMGTIAAGRGGAVTHKLASWTIPVRWLRIRLIESSNTCDTHGSYDKRNCVGYAINELYVGKIGADGQFTDQVKHAASRQQTVTWASSVDPWASAADVDYSLGDQIGFDLFFTSGITRGLPTMVPIALIYANPEDAANQIAYLYKRRYPISWIEMGEEADGKHIEPEDYATLYLQFAKAIHKLVPEAKLGGPAFEGTFEDVEFWPDANGDASFLRRFVNYLKAHGRLSDFTFFSFEHYPFLGRRASTQWSDLYKEPEFVSHIIQVWKDNGLPPNVPFFMTEGNFGGGAGPTDLKAGLWLADYVGAMMTGGAGGTFFFHYIPSPGGGGNFLMLDRGYNARAYPPQYLASQVITKEWVQPVDQTHKLYKVTSDVKDSAGNEMVSAYAVERPDALWSLMLVNKDRDNDHAVKVVFANPETKRDQYFTGTLDRISLSAAEYQWHGDAATGHPDPDGPASKTTITGRRDALYQIPKASIIVLRGKIAAQ